MHSLLPFRLSIQSDFVLKYAAARSELDFANTNTFQKYAKLMELLEKLECGAKKKWPDNPMVVFKIKKNKT